FLFAAIGVKSSDFGGSTMSEANGNAADYFIERHLREGRGEQLAFTDPWRSLSYAQLSDASARFAAGLAKAGIERERRIALLMLDTIDFPIAFWGALRAGIVPVPINTLLPADITEYILRHSRPAALAGAGRGSGDNAALSANDLCRRADALRRAVGPECDRSGCRLRPAAPLHLGRRAASRAYRAALARGGRQRHPRWVRLDRDAAHLSVEPPRRYPLRHDRQAGA